METWIEPEDNADRTALFSYAPLSTMMERRIEPIDKSAEPLASLNVIAKITFGGILSVRDDKSKLSYKGPLLRALSGDLVISKIRVGQGSFCIIRPEEGSVAVSPEYPTYQLDGLKVLDRYLALCLRSGHFLRRLRGTGNTTKQRITPVFFEALRVPLPSLDEQRTLIATYDAALSKAVALEAAAATAEANGLAAFEAALGLAAPTPLPDVPRFIASFKDMDRWSHEAVLRRLTIGGDDSGKHPIVQLGDVIADLENGWSPQCLTRPAKPEEWGVLKLGAVSFGVFDPTENKALPPTLKPRPSLEVTAGDMLISRANVVRLVGATAYVADVRPRLMLCDKIFRVVPLPEEPVDLTFIAQILRIPAVRWQIESKLTGTSPTMKNISKPALLSLSFPCPVDIDEQRSLIGKLEDARSGASTLRRQATAKRVNAWRAFEAAIYGE